MAEILRQRNVPSVRLWREGMDISIGKEVRLRRTGALGGSCQGSQAAQRGPAGTCLLLYPFRVLRSVSGFTLIELMVVIIILGILAGLIVPRIMEDPEKAKVVKAKLQIESFSTALKRYKLDNGDYPSTEQSLQALVEKPTIGKIPSRYPEKGYLSKIPKDPWGNDYIYICPGEHGDYDIISYGADGQEGGEDKNEDVRSWEIE
jgi:general secretion pathway protein G